MTFDWLPTGVASLKNGDVFTSASASLKNDHNTPDLLLAPFDELSKSKSFLGDANPHVPSFMAQPIPSPPASKVALLRSPRSYQTYKLDTTRSAKPSAQTQDHALLEKMGNKLPIEAQEALPKQLAQLPSSSSKPPVDPYFEPEIKLVELSAIQTKPQYSKANTDRRTGRKRKLPSKFDDGISWGAMRTQTLRKIKTEPVDY